MGKTHNGSTAFLMLGLLLVAFAVALLILLGCATQMPVKLSPEIQAVVAAQADIDRSVKELAARVEGTGNVVDQSTRTADEWTARLGQVRDIIGELGRWWPWLVLGIPFATYILPKLAWVLILRLTGNGKRRL